MTKKAKVMVFGTFDTVHKGHRFFIREAKKYGNVIIVVARDANVRRFKPRLKHTENSRLKGVEKAFPSCNVTLGYREDSQAIIREYSPDFICLGYDQESFDAGLAEAFPDIKVVRIAPFEPDKYKSSKILT
jgi:FAD synthetase